MAIVALESQRASAFIVGEDLGTVEPGVRERLHDHRMLSYRLLYFEPTPPEHSPSWRSPASRPTTCRPSPACGPASTPPRRRQIGFDPNEAGTKALRDKLRALGDLDEDAHVESVIESTYRALAQAPSRVLLATLDDAVAVPERPNLPGTVNEWPNWSLALEKPLEEIEAAGAPRPARGRAQKISEAESARRGFAL